MEGKKQLSIVTRCAVLFQGMVYVLSGKLILSSSVTTGMPFTANTTSTNFCFGGAVKHLAVHAQLIAFIKHDCIG